MVDLRRLFRIWELRTRRRKCLDHTATIYDLCNRNLLLEEAVDEGYKDAWRAGWDAAMASERASELRGRQRLCL